MPQMVKNVDSDRKLLDSVVYMISMISRRDVMEGFVDTLSMITIGVSDNRSLSEKQRAKVLELKHKVEDYLVKNDPLLAISKRKLREKVVGSELKGDFSDQHPMSIVLLIMTVTLLVVLAVVYLTEPFNSSFSVRLQSAMPLMFIGVNVALAWLYYTVLSDFKDRFKKAHYFNIIALLLIGVVSIQLPVVQAIEAYDVPFLMYNAFIPPYAIATMFFYMSVRQMGKILNVRSFLVNSKWMFAGSLVAFAIAAQAVWLVNATNAFEFVVAFGGEYATAWFSFTAAFTAWVVMRTASERYTAPLRWLGWSLVLNAAGSIVYSYWIFISPSGGVAPPYIAVSFLFSEALLFTAGVIFRKKMKTRLIEER